MRGTTLALTLGLFGAAACGKVNHLVDGGPAGDGKGADAFVPPVDAVTVGPVVVTVLDPSTGKPMANVPVAFVEADGTTAGEPLTGTDGKATANVHVGASVTAIFPVPTGSSQHELDTVMGVKPNDQITIGYGQDTTDLGTFTVTVPQFDTTATHFDVYGPCGAQTWTPLPPFAATTLSGTVQLDILAYCKEDPMDLVVVAADGSNTPLHSVEIPNVTFTANGSASATGTVQAIAAMATTYTNVPTEVSGMSASVYVPDAPVGFTTGLGLTIATGSASGSFMVPPASRTMIDTAFNNGITEYQDIYEVVAGTPSTYGYDASASLLAWVGLPTFDQPTQTLSTKFTGTAAGDVFVAQMSWNRTVPAGSGSTTESYSWFVFTGTPGDVKLPALPTDLAGNLPNATDTLTGTSALLADIDAVTSYDQIRGSLFNGVDAYYNGRGGVGRFRVSQSQPNRGVIGMVGGGAQRGPHRNHALR